MHGRIANFAKILSLLAAFVVTSVVMGLLGAGLVMPAVGATGAAARGGVDVFDSLPGEFATSPLSQQSRILASDGSLIATPYDENRVIVPLKAIAPVMRQAQVAIEDSRFYEHGGLDTHGIARAVVETMKGNKQGASTLTQQYVKITLQENCLQKDDKECAARAIARDGVQGYTRKLQELKYAVTLEKQLTKDQILEGYLNLVYYGDQAYGVEAAARHYFGVTAAKLNLAQAATLAGVVQQPGVTDPVNHPEAALDRRNVVLDRMLELRLVTPAAHKVARTSKLVLNVKPAQNSCTVSPYPYFCSYVIAWLKEQPALGRSVAERTKAIYRGGLTIQTTIDPKMMKLAQRELVKNVPIGNRSNIGAAAAIIEPGTGKVLAIAQNTVFANKSSAGRTAVNWAVDEKYGSSGGFAIGSTAKVFTIAGYLKAGNPINSRVYARPADPYRPAHFSSSDFPRGDCWRDSRGWNVENDDARHNGSIPLVDAAAFSVNTAFAGLVAKMGVCKTRDLMTAMGLHESGGRPIAAGPSAVTLGSRSSSPLTLAAGYATVASGGKQCVPIPVLTVITNDKKVLPIPKSQCKRVLDPSVANGTTKVLTHVLSRGTAAGNGLANGRPAAGKTGTTENNNETWFVGYTPQLSTAVWVGTPNDKGNRQRLNNVRLGGKYYSRLFGGTLAAPIWQSIMNQASAGMPIRAFGEPSDKVTNGDTVRVPDVLGMSISQARGVLRDRGFDVVVGSSVASRYVRGTVAEMSPRGGDRDVRGATIIIRASTGRAQAATKPAVQKPGPKARKPPARPRPIPTKPPRRP